MVTRNIFVDRQGAFERSLRNNAIYDSVGSPGRSSRSPQSTIRSRTPERAADAKELPDPSTSERKRNIDTEIEEFTRKLKGILEEDLFVETPSNKYALLLTF